MGLKSKTHQGTGSNKLSFDDTTGKENITLHGQYDMNTTIENDQTLLVNNDRTENVLGQHTETITKDTLITIALGNFTHNVNTGTADYYVKSNLFEKYDANQTTTVTSSQKTSVGDNIEITAQSGYIHLTAFTEIKLVVGSSTLLMSYDGSIQLSGVNIAINGSESINFHGGSINSKADNDHNIIGAIVTSHGSATNTLKGRMVMLNP